MNYILLTQQGGILKPFAWALGKIFEVIYSALDMVGIESIGLCIIVFTIIVRLFLLPMSIKQQKFTKLNAVMSPEITAIQNKYKGKKDQQSQMNMNAEIQAVYDKYGVSPAGSCLQIVIQMPILFALYRVIYNVPAYVGQVKNYYMNIINDMTPAQISEYFKIKVDSVSKLSGVDTNNIIDALYGYTRAKVKLPEGIDLATVVEAVGTDKAEAALKNINKINHFFMFDLQLSPGYMYHNGTKIAVIIPILAALSQFVVSQITMSMNKSNTQTKGAEENPMMSSMKTMNYVFPFMSAFMCWQFPSALGIYWVVSSTVMLIQQVGLNLYFNKVSVDDLIAESKAKAEKKREKRGFTANMISNAAAMNATLNDNNNSNNSSNASLTRKQKEEQYEKAMEKHNNSISSDKNSISARANMVREFDNKKK